MAVQLISIVTSIAVLRWLPKDEYAWYSVANGMQGSLAIFSLTGVSTGLFSLASSAEGKNELGRVIASARRMRVLLGVFGLVVAVPVFAQMLSSLKCSWYVITGLLALAVATLWLAIQRQMLVLPLNLNQNYLTPQLESLLSTVSRLLLIVLIVEIGFSSALYFSMASVAAASFGLYLITKRASKLFDSSALPSARISKKLIQHFWVGLPSSLTYLVESQVVTIMVSLAGGTGEVADLGALTRLALLFAIPSAVLGGVLTPRLSMVHDIPHLKRLWLRTTALAAVLGLVLCASIWLASPIILWVFGPQYRHLKFELWLMALLQAFIFTVNVFQAPLTAKGWVQLSWMRPFFCFGGQLIALIFLDVTTVAGAIGIMAAGAIGNTLLSGWMLWRGWQGKGRI